MTRPASDPWRRLPTTHHPVLQRYLALLERWNRKIDLVAPAPSEVLTIRHLLDSWELLQLVPPERQRLLDVGSGAGLPGLVWALLRPELAVTLLEPRSRRAAFLRVAAGELGAAVTVRTERAEALCGRGEQFDLVVGRAVAPYLAWLELAAPLVRPAGLLLATAAAEPPTGWNDARCTLAWGLLPVVEHIYELPGQGSHRALALRRRMDLPT